MFASPHTTEKAMRSYGAQDDTETRVAYMQDLGSAYGSEALATARALDGFDVRFAVASGDKETSAKPVALRLRQATSRSYAAYGMMSPCRAGEFPEPQIRVLASYPHFSRPGSGKRLRVFFADYRSGAFQRCATATARLPLRTGLTLARD
jgi:hypothetical protein